MDTAPIRGVNPVQRGNTSTLAVGTGLRGNVSLDDLPLGEQPSTGGA